MSFSKCRTLVLSLLSFFLFSVPAKLQAEEPELREPASVTEAIRQSAQPEEAPEEGLTGDWGGRGAAWREAGVDFQATYKGEGVQNLSGGLERKGAYLGNLDLRLNLDLEKIAGISGLSFFIYGLGDHGDAPSEFIGDTFKTSNIEAPNTFKLYEIYLKQNIGEHFSLLAGTRDLNADYNNTPSAGDFLNSSFGITTAFAQTGPNGPSIFPITALAVNMKYEIPDSFYAQAGVFNAIAGNPDQPKGTYINTKNDEGTLAVAEVGFFQEQDDKVHKYGLGAWRYSKAEAAIDPAKEEKRNEGIYLIIDHAITPGVCFFLKHALATPEVNTFASATETGLVLKGLIPSRTDDALSIGYAEGRTSEDSQSVEGSTSSESVIEIAYSLAVSNGVRLIPDLQFISNPGLSEDIKDAQVGAIRVEVNF